MVTENFIIELTGDKYFNMKLTNVPILKCWGYYMYIALLCLDTQIKVIWNYCRYGITDSTLKGTVAISCFDKDPFSPIIEVDPLFKMRCISPMYHNNRAK